MPTHNHSPASVGVRLSVALAAIFGLAPSDLFAQARWAANGIQVCVIPGCSGFEPMVCTDGAGGALVAWNRDPTFADQNIYLHRVLYDGVLSPVWPPKGTPVTRAPDDQLLQDLVTDGGGGAFVLWYEWPSYDIYVQHVLGNGQIAPGWPTDGLPVCVKAGYQLAPRMIADGTGGVFVAWQDGDFVDPGDIYAQRLSADGTVAAGWPAGGLAVCADPGHQGVPRLSSDGAGGFFVAWGDLRGGSLAEIYAMRVTGSGELAPEWPLNGRAIIDGDVAQGLRGLVPDGMGGAYVGWELVHGPDAYDNDIYATRIHSDGTVAPGWQTAGYPVSTRPFTQYLTGMVADGTGGVLLAWYDNWKQPAVAFVQRLAPGGEPALGWPSDGVPVSNITGWQFAPRIAPDGNGGAYIAAEIQTDSNEGFLQHLLPDGARAPGWPASGIALVVDPTRSSSQEELAIAYDGTGGAIVAWHDFRAGRPYQIYSQRFYGDGPTPVQVALASVDASPDRVVLTWHRAEGALTDAEVQRRREGEQWAVLGSAPFDGAGRLRYEDRGLETGALYAYRVAWVEAGSEHFSPETWVEIPAALAFALEGARPNPALGPLTVAFTLPRQGRATLELLDVSGRLVQARDLGGLGPGQHTVRLGECGCTPPGMYWLRLTQGGHALVKRAAVIR